jgi:hypothetical protein
MKRLYLLAFSALLLTVAWCSPSGAASTYRVGNYARVEVPATIGTWQDTGIDICPDAIWSIVTQGSVTGWSDTSRSWLGPGGMGSPTPFNWADALVPSAPLLSLVARVGTLDWFVGGGAGIPGFLGSGRLYLGVNDTQAGDNAGYFIAQLYCVQGDCECGSPSSAPANAPLTPQFQLGATAPNPMASLTGFLFETAVAAHYRIEIYDAGGRLVRVVLDGDLVPGSHRLEWDATDGGGRPVASGTYFYVATGPSGEVARKLVVIR